MSKKKTNRPRRGRRRTLLSTSKGGTFTTRSSYENRFVQMLESDESVISFIYEPYKIEYIYLKKKCNYIPDFLVHYFDGHEELIEVKPSKMVYWSKNKAKIKAGHLFHNNFKVITEKELRK